MHFAIINLVHVLFVYALQAEDVANCVLHALATPSRMQVKDHVTFFFVIDIPLKKSSTFLFN